LISKKVPERMNLWAKVLAHASSQKVCGFNTTAVQFGTAAASYTLRQSSSGAEAGRPNFFYPAIVHLTQGHQCFG